MSAPMPDFVRLLTQYQPDIFVYIRSLLANPHEAADVLQDANVVLWEKREQFKPGTSFRGWAFQIAKFKVLQHIGRRDRAPAGFSAALVDELSITARQNVLAADSAADRLRLPRKTSGRRSRSDSAALFIAGDQRKRGGRIGSAGALGLQVRLANSEASAHLHFAKFRPRGRSLMNQASRELLDFIDHACEGTLTADETARLESLLTGDPEAQQLYLAYMRLDGRLRWEFGQASIGATAAAGSQSSPTPPMSEGQGEAAVVAASADTHSTHPAAAKSPVLGFLGGVVDYVSHSRTLMFSLVCITLAGYFAIHLGSILLERFHAQNVQVADDFGGAPAAAVA